MIVYVITSIENAKVLRPKTFQSENTAMTEFRKMYLERLKHYTELAKNSNSIINYSAITDSKVYISAGLNKEYYFEMKIDICMIR